LKSARAPGGGRRIYMLLSNPATFDQRPLKEAHALSKSGFNVTILAWDRELETKSDSQFDDGLVVKRMRVGAGHGTPFLTVPKLLLFYAWCLAHLAFTRVDAVHCHDVDTLPAGYAARAIKLNWPRLVYDMHDLPEAFLRFFPLTRLTQSLALSTARRAASAVLVVNERFVDYLVKLGFSGQKLEVIMNSPPSSAGRKTKQRGERLHVLYYGGLSEERGVKLLLDAVNGLDGVILSLAGRGELEGMVRERAATDPSVKFLGWLKMNELEPAIREADLIPSLYEPRSRNAIMATPGKLLTAMSLSVPTLVPAGSYQAEIVQKFRCGLVVDWKSPSEVRDAIRRLSVDRRLYDDLASSSYDAFVSNFSWEVMEGRLVGLYRRLIPAS
jgi:glycosyltransferase involved in cell wall biosynthesis